MKIGSFSIAIFTSILLGFMPCSSHAATLPAPNAETTHWSFSSSTTAADFGPATMTATGVTATTDTFVTETVGGSSATVLDFTPRAAPADGYAVRAGIDGATGGGSADGIEIWTMVLDIRFTDAGVSYMGIYNGNPNNSNDAELFIRPNTGGFWSSGTGSFAAGALTLNQFHRIVYRIDYLSNVLDIFVDGVNVSGPIVAPDYIYDGDPHPFAFLGDDTPSETGAGQLAAFGFTNVLLSDAEIATLGAPDAAGIFSLNEKFCPTTLQGTLSSTDPYTVDLAWQAHQGLDSTGIEVLLGNDVIATLAADAATYTHNPDLSAGSGTVELDYSVRMTGGEDSAGCDPITAKVLVYTGLSIDGLVAYFDFNSDSAADTSAALGGSASTNDGLWTGTPVYKAGAFGRAADVGDGAGSNFITSSGDEFDFGADSSFTVVYWLNTENAVGGDPSIIAGGGKNWSASGAAQGWVSLMGGGDDLKANIGDGTNRGDTGYIDIDHDAYWAGRGVPGDHWNFVAMVVDRDAQTLTNYAADEWVQVLTASWASGILGQDFGQDSSFPTTDADISNVGDLTAGNLNIVMGQDGDGAGYSLPTSGLDDVSVWNRALSRGELWEIYGEGRANAKSLSAIISKKTCPSALQVTLASTDPFAVDLAWVAHEGLDSTGIEVLLGNDVIATLAADATTYTHNPDLSAEGGLVDLNYSVRMTGGADSAGCDPLTASVQVNAGSLLDDLVLYLPLDGDSIDYSGNGNNGSLSGDPDFSAGQIGNSLTLVDTADPHQFVDLSNPADLNFGTDTDFTVSVWVNNLGGFADNRGIGGSATDPAIASNKDWNSGGNAGWVIAGTGDGGWQWNIGDGATRLDYDSPAGQISDGEWHHLLVSHDRDGLVRLYYDGTEVANGNMSEIGDIDSGLYTAIGTDGVFGSAWPNWFPGSIDEVAIWRRVVLPDEVAAITAAGTAGTPLREGLFVDIPGLSAEAQASLVAHYDGRTGVTTTGSTVDSWTPVDGSGTAIPGMEVTNTQHGNVDASHISYDGSGTLTFTDPGSGGRYLEGSLANSASTDFTVFWLGHYEADAPSATSGNYAYNIGPNNISHQRDDGGGGFAWRCITARPMPVMTSKSTMASIPSGVLFSPLMATMPMPMGRISILLEARPTTSLPMRPSSWAHTAQVAMIWSATSAR